MSDIKNDILRARLPFWERLREAQRESLLANTRSVRYKKSSIIADIGEDCGFIIVRRGRVCACTVSEEGREIALMRCFSGDICLLAAHTLTDTTGFNLCIGAETEADVLIIDSHIFADICKTNIHAEAFTRRTLSAHFHDVVLSMQSMLLNSPEKRVAVYLCAEADRTGSARIHITHEQLAKHIGTAREVVSRTLKKLSEEGTVTLERGGVVIHDRAGLMATPNNSRHSS